MIIEQAGKNVFRYIKTAYDEAIIASRKNCD